MRYHVCEPNFVASAIEDHARAEVKAVTNSDPLPTSAALERRRSHDPLLWKRSCGITSTGMPKLEGTPGKLQPSTAMPSKLNHEMADTLSFQTSVVED
jgi:hypothetical protein